MSPTSISDKAGTFTVKRGLTLSIRGSLFLMRVVVASTLLFVLGASVVRVHVGNFDFFGIIN